MPVVELPEPDGTVYVSLRDLRLLPNLGDEAAYPDDEIVAARNVFETTFEEFTGMAFVPRAATYRLEGSGYRTLVLPHYPIRSVTAVRVYTSATEYTAFTTDQLADVLPAPDGSLMRVTGGWWPWALWNARNIEVDYVHGQAAPPADVVRAAKTAIQEMLMQDRSGRPIDRTYGTATDGIYVRNIIEDDKHPFGLASVDAVACRYRKRYRVPAIA